MAVTNVKKLVYPYNGGADQAVADFTNIPTLNGNNAFTGSNTFTNIVKTDSGDSWETINNNDFITKAEVNLELDQIKQDITAIEQGGISAATTEKAGIVELATNTEITSGTAKKVVTADGLKTVTDTINSSITNLGSQITNITNGTTALPAATEAKAGIIELATKAEVTTGTDTKRAVTPATLKGVTDTIKARITNITNGTTAITLPDASTTKKGVVELADADEISAGTATNKVVTVKNVMDMITTQIKAQDVHHVVASLDDIPAESPDGVYIVTGA